jgi:chromosome segregation ATPase
MAGVRVWLGSQSPLPKDEGVPAVNENNSSTMSFDRMRNMMMRAAEVRESEQQQIFDALDEIHARLAPVETLGAVRKRLSELPDRTEVSVLAERLDEALAKLEAQDQAISGVGRTVDSVVDKLAKPFAELDGRLDGVGNRFEGVAIRMDGLEDKLSHLHKRLDDLDHHLERQDDRLHALPREVHVPLRERLDALETTLRGRVDEVGEGVHEHIDGTREALFRSIADAAEAVTGASKSTVDAARDALANRLGDTQQALTGKVDDSQRALVSNLDMTREQLHANVNGTRDGLKSALDEARDLLDPTDKFQTLAERLEQVTGRLDSMANRLDAVENGIAGRIGDLSGTVEQGLGRVRDTVSQRPDNDSLVTLVRDANSESERRHAGQLDEAMATFAELILGGGMASSTPPPPTALPRQQRRARGPKPKTNGKEIDLEAELAEGA